MGKYYTTTLQKGSQGDEVKEWQKFLLSQGYNLSVDGDFGPNTEKWTMDWQTKNGLGADGIVCENSWGKAGYTNVNFTPTAAPNINNTSTPLPTIDTTSWDDTTKGSAALGAYNTAKDAVTGYGPFTFSEADWQTDVEKRIKNFKDFSYDIDSDALYQQYKDKYIQQGKLAMADTMGQAAALTGGYGSSYAQSVGQQAYQASLDNLNDIVPELYNMALDRYKMEKDDLYTQASYLLQRYEQEYGEYSDEYQRLLDALGIASDDYYKGADMYHTEQDTKNTEAWNNWNAEESIRKDSNDELWNIWNAEETNRQTVVDDYWKGKEFDALYGDSSDGGNGGNGGNDNTGGNYDNGGLTDAQVEELQEALGVSVDGKWGSQSTEAAGGLSADEAWKAYQEGKLGNVETKGWEDHSEDDLRANVKENGGSYYSTALNDLKQMKTSGMTKDEMTAYVTEMVGNSYISKSEGMTLMQWIRDNMTAGPMPETGGSRGRR